MSRRSRRWGARGALALPIVLLCLPAAAALPQFVDATREAGIGDLVRRAPDDALRTSLPVLIVPTLDDRRIATALAGIPGRRPPVIFRADGHWERTVFTYRSDGAREADG